MGSNNQSALSIWLFGPDDYVECAYRCGVVDEELLFEHQGELVCSCCLESWEGLSFNHPTKRFRKVVK